MKPEDRAKALAKLDKLSRVLRELREGVRSFPITRLTVLKSFCEDPKATVVFGLHLVEQVKTNAPKCYRRLIDDAIIQIQKRLTRLSRPAPQATWDALIALRQSQNEIKHHRWADVRIIHCQEALLTEYALRCVLRPSESSNWGYRMAATYAERYDPRHGTGLIPESATALEEIIAFWSRSTDQKACSRSRTGRRRRET